MVMAMKESTKIYTHLYFTLFGQRFQAITAGPHHDAAVRQRLVRNQHREHHYR
jgi:hypothetical protein